MLAILRPSCSAALLVAVVATAAPPVLAASARPPPFPYRLDEDWTFLRDSRQRTDPLDALKFIPFGPAAADLSLTLGGEVRHRFESYRNDLWGAVPDDDKGYHHLRFMLHADLRAARQWRAYVELKSGLVEDKQAPLKPPEKDTLDLHQALVEWQSSSAPGAPTLLVRAGRQEFNYGSSRILTFRDGPNVRQSFDAGVVRVQHRGRKLDLFYGRPSETDVGSFDNQTTDQQLIYGLYGVTPLGLLPGAHLDLYVMGYDRDLARFPGGVGHEERYSVGARLWGRLRNLDYNFEALVQWGTFRDQDIQAWTLASDTGYTLTSAPTRPRLYVKANIISGDRRPGDGRLQTFNALYPRGAYFGDIGLLGPANLFNLHPGIVGRLTERWSYHVDGVFYWRHGRADGVYNAGGALVRPPNGSRELYIGTQADFVLTWTYNRQLSVEAAYARFFSGPFLEATGLARDVDYVSLMSRFRF